jgi:hypothetical protein
VTSDTAFGNLGRKFRPAIFAPDERHVAAMRASEFAGEPEPEALSTFLGGVFGAEEALKQSCAMFGSDAWSGIGDGKPPRGAIVGERHAHFAVVAVVFHGIVQKVAGDLGKAERVHASARCVGQRALDADATLLGNDARVLDAGFGELGEVVFGEIEREASSVGTGKEQEAGGDVSKAARLLAASR